MRVGFRLEGHGGLNMWAGSLHVLTVGARRVASMGLFQGRLHMRTMSSGCLASRRPVLRCFYIEAAWAGRLASMQWLLI